MLVNLRKDRKIEKSWKRWNRELNKLYPEEKQHNIKGFDRFTKLANGVYLAKDIMCSPYNAITNCTRSYSDGYGKIYGLCDNAEQVINLYNNIMNNNEADECSKFFISCKKDYINYYINNPDKKYAKKYAKYWSGNHVIIMWKMDNFRWHKWGDYIGIGNPRCEYFLEDVEKGNVPNIVYAFEIYKVI